MTREYIHEQIEIYSNSAHDQRQLAREQDCDWPTSEYLRTLERLDYWQERLCNYVSGSYIDIVNQVQELEAKVDSLLEVSHGDVSCAIWTSSGKLITHIFWREGGFCMINSREGAVTRSLQELPLGDKLNILKLLQDIPVV